MFTLETYLTEKLLGEVLIAWAGEENVVKQPMVPGTRMRYDYEVTRPGRKLFVEFDGDSHFRDANVIFRDDTKDKISETLGKEVVRIPYFIQLDTETFKLFFKEDFEISTTFPHGFIATKMLPASYCRIGFIRASRILDGMPDNVYKDVMRSLQDKSKTLPVDYVFYQPWYDVGGKSVRYEEMVANFREAHGDKYDYTRSQSL